MAYASAWSYSLYWCMVLPGALVSCGGVRYCHVGGCGVRCPLRHSSDGLMSVYLLEYTRLLCCYMYIHGYVYRYMHCHMHGYKTGSAQRFRHVACGRWSWECCGHGSVWGRAASSEGYSRLWGSWGYSPTGPTCTAPPAPTRPDRPHLCQIATEQCAGSN